MVKIDEKSNSTFYLWGKMLNLSEPGKEILQALKYSSAQDDLFPLRSVQVRSLNAAEPGFRLSFQSNLILVLPTVTLTTIKYLIISFVWENFES